MLTLVVSAAILAPAPPGIARGLEADAAPDHLVVSEVATGGASASDELIELHNPTAAPLPLEGLELVYVTASGATVSTRAKWEVGAPSVPAGGHVLVANEAGIYAPIADARYAAGMAATGGSVALRIQGAASAIDAVGWGTAASAWLEGAPVAAPPAGSSIERLPGGSAGSSVDSDDNASDFVERAIPEPQNLGSAPTPMPGTTPTPSPSPSASGTPPGSPAPSVSPTGSESATPVPSASPTPSDVVTIAAARAMPDGATVTIEGVALAGSSFHDGGGFVVDASGGIAVLPSDATFEAGQSLRVTGEVDDRFSQRTLRPPAGGIFVLGSGDDPEASAVATGAIGEQVEGRLVRVTGAISGSPTELSTSIAFDLDDGSGPTRVLVGTLTAIGTDAWVPGATVDLVGVAGQRDSTGSGSDGYRVMPRTPADIISVVPPATPTPSPTGGGASPSPTPDPGAGGVVTVAEARAAEANARVRVRGVITLPTGLVDERTAVVQDDTGAILLRLSGNAGQLALGERVEAAGARSTLAGMESVRVTTDPTRLGTAPQPAAVAVPTGSAAEAREALLVVVRGAVVASARRSSSGSVSFEVDDGSGALRVSAAPSARLDRNAIVAGTWLEVRGVLGQETTRAEPTAGYRIWPRTAADVRIVAPATGAASGSTASTGMGANGGGGATLADLGDGDLSRLRVGATLVIGRWEEIGVGGLLWDGHRLVAIHPSSAAIVEGIVGDRPGPRALELASLTAAGHDPRTGATRVRLGPSASDTTVIQAAPAPPSGDPDAPRPAWVSLVGRPHPSSSGTLLLAGGARLRIELRCDGDGDASRADLDADRVRVTGVALAGPDRILVPCGGVRPAPVLGAAAPSEQPGPQSDDPPALVGATRPATADPRRALAAGVLLVAATALAAAAWLRRGREDGAGVESDGQAAVPSAEIPQLTLVSVRNEHGP